MGAVTIEVPAEAVGSLRREAFGLYSQRAETLYNEVSTPGRKGDDVRQSRALLAELDALLDTIGWNEPPSREEQDTAITLDAATLLDLAECGLECGEEFQAAALRVDRVEMRGVMAAAEWWAEARAAAETRAGQPAAVTAASPRDGGCDLVLGCDVTGRRIGRVGWDPRDGGGLVLRIDGDPEDHLPDSVEDAARILAGRGYRLDADSLLDIDALAPKTEEEA